MQRGGGAIIRFFAQGLAGCSDGSAGRYGEVDSPRAFSVSLVPLAKAVNQKWDKWKIITLAPRTPPKKAHSHVLRRAYVAIPLHTTELVKEEEERGRW